MSNMNSNNVEAYRVVGRYMTGSTVTGYHLVGLDGKQAKVTKERLLYMTGRGQIGNMRVQANGTEMILRGKGINLNNLPVYDEKTNKFRSNAASKDAASTLVAPKKNSGVNPMGQLRITKRIIFKNTCLGYMVVDFSGKERKLSREKVIELAIQKLISNATVQKYTPPGSDKAKLILRGAGCDLSTLPALIVDSNGKIVDPSLDKGEVRMRATRMKRGGIIHDKQNKKNITFNAGDYLVCGVKGVIRALKELDFKSKLSADSSSNAAICDEYLDGLKNYTVEIFGSVEREITAGQVGKWAIVKANKR